MTKIIVSLVLAAGALFAVAPAQSQQTVQCPPGQTAVGAYCQTIPAGCDKLPAKLQLLRSTFKARARTIDSFALITSKASGRVEISLQAAGATTTFTAPIDSARGWIRTVRRISQSQADLGTGILTIAYDGDADTRPQTLRLRAANNPANLQASRPTISTGGVLKAGGTVTRRAEGVVRVQIQYVNRADGQTVTLQYKAPIDNGRWSLSRQLPANVLAQIATRCGTVHSYVAFTGYMPRRIRGESRSFQVLPAP